MTDSTPTEEKPFDVEASKDSEIVDKLFGLACASASALNAGDAILLALSDFKQTAESSGILSPRTQFMLEIFFSGVFAGLSYGLFKLAGEKFTQRENALTRQELRALRAEIKALKPQDQPNGP